MQMSQHIGTTLLLIVSSLVLGGCERGPAAPPRVATIEVGPASVQVHAGDTVQMAARLLDASGAEITGRPVEWSSSDTSLARVLPDGRVVTLRQGNIVVTAASEGITGIGYVGISAPLLARIEISPQVVEGYAGREVFVSAQPLTWNGEGQWWREHVYWASSDTTVVKVARYLSDYSARIALELRAPGTATLTATSGGLTDQASVTVALAPVGRVLIRSGDSRIIPGESTQLSAVAFATDGPVAPGHTFTWTSSAPDVARVDSMGRVTGVAPGTATITAAVGDVFATTVVQVEPRTPSGTLRLTLTSPHPTRRFFLLFDQGPYGERPQRIEIASEQYMTRVTKEIGMPQGSGYRIRVLAGDSVYTGIAGSSGRAEGVAVADRDSVDLQIDLSPIRVESIEAPDTVAAGDTVTIRYTVVDHGETLEFYDSQYKSIGEIRASPGPFTDYGFVDFGDSARGVKISEGRYLFTIRFVVPQNPGVVYFQTRTYTMANLDTTGSHTRTGPMYVFAPSTRRGEPLRTFVVR